MKFGHLTTVTLTALFLSLLASLCSCTENCTTVHAACKVDKPADTTLKILTIGNSFTRNGTRYLDQIIEADGRVKLIHGKAWIGGSDMARHLRHVKENLADPTMGKPYNKKSLLEMLTAEKWDIVTIQQLSIKSDHAETYQPEGGELVEFIRKHAPQAEIWLQETWAYREDDTKQYNDNYSQEDMYKNLHEAYLKFAAAEGIKTIIPTGTAFQTARRDPAWQFEYPDKNYDYDNPKYPEAPRQDKSLNVGYFWSHRSTPAKFTCDTHHANANGEYLGSCVWFEKLFGLSVVGNSFVPERVSEEDAKFLQKIAHKTVSMQK